MKRRNVLVTGGAGFIGINLVDYLLKTRQYKITVVDNLSTGNYALLQKIARDNGGDTEGQLSLSPGKVCFYQVDILEKEDITRILKGQHQVVHLAAQTGVMPSVEDPFGDARVNITGTLNLLSEAVEHHIQAFVFASSAAPLGEQEPPVHENKVPGPLAPYGASKLAGEAYCSAFYGSYGLSTVVLRFSNVYGPNSFHKGSVVAHFIKKILKNEPLTIYGDGQQTRDFLYVEDIVRIIDKILNGDNQKISGEIFQLGTGVETSINHLVDCLKEVTGLPIEVIYLPERKGEIIRNFASIEKIKKRLGYQPQFSLKTGLEKTWKWFNK